jgi:hypothetical protein
MDQWKSWQIIPMIWFCPWKTGKDNPIRYTLDKEGFIINARRMPEVEINDIRR